MKKKDYEELRNTITKMVKIIDEKIENENLYDYFNDNFSYVLNNFSKIKFEFTDNQINIIYNDGGIFTIQFLPNIENFNTIFTRKKFWNNQRVETKQIKFVDNAILLNESKFTKYVYSGTNNIASIKKDVNKKVYIDNKLSYEYEFINEMGSDENNRVETIIKEIYIKDKRAVKQLIIINNDTDEYANTYLETDYYDVPDFNTRKIGKGLYQYSMGWSKYDNFKRIKDELEESNKISELKAKVFEKVNL